MSNPMNIEWHTGDVSSNNRPPLSLENVHVSYSTRKGKVQAVRGVTLDLHAGESLALIGESGSGKSTLGLAIVRLLPETASVSPGVVIYRRGEREVDVLKLSAKDLREFRWSDCAMVFQAALNAFNPVLTVWNQTWDTAKAHGWQDKKAVRERLVESLRFVQLDPKRVIDAYPHELSGGMRQRVLLALSLLLDPQVLILDEPTTALDIITQRTIIKLLRQLKEEQHFTMIFISHDLAIAAELADRVATMYAGRVVELGPSGDIFYRPRHPYTLGLIRAVPTVTGGFEQLFSIPGSPPDLINLPSGLQVPSALLLCHGSLQAGRAGADPDRRGSRRSLLELAAGRRGVEGESLASRRPERPGGSRAGRGGALMTPIIELRNLTKQFGKGKETVTAVDAVSLAIEAGETVCLVGESGCGKSTTGRMVAGLLPATTGRNPLQRSKYHQTGQHGLPAYRQAVQIIHQDPYSSLNPTQTIRQIITAPLLHHHKVKDGAGAEKRAIELLEIVDLTPARDIIDKYPHQLSGGQRQRVAVARALTLEPKFIVADEAVSMVDVSIRVSILSMLTRLKKEFDVTFLFITHDLALAKYFAWTGRITVMYLGRIVEDGPTPRIVADPRHPYTQALLSAVPEADPELAHHKRHNRPARRRDSEPAQSAAGLHLSSTLPLFRRRPV